MLLETRLMSKSDVTLSFEIHVPDSAKEIKSCMPEQLLAPIVDHTPTTEFARKVLVNPTLSVSPYT